ncbi:MAG: hypothetical protein QME81_16100 [bacterium]|nr:hypothetical protein [bacterium]
MAQTITCKERFMNEINLMSEIELEKIYKMVMFVKNEFIDEGESRYYTKGWIDAEKEATEIYKKGDLIAFDSVRGLSDFIEDNIESLRKE